MTGEPHMEPDLVVINLGNTRTQLALAQGGELSQVESIRNEDRAAVLDAIAARWRNVTDPGTAALLLASVDDAAATTLLAAIRGRLGVDAVRIGDDVAVPISVVLDPETITGVDRTLNALAAFESVKQAAIIVDAGTAITVDFVDGEGTFHGGAIAPGARLQLKSLHDYTAALPELEFRAPDGEAFGRSTNQAMLNGVYHGIRGMVWRLAERYAEYYGAYPIIIATGGDAITLFGDDGLIDRIVPDLTLRGMVLAMHRHWTTHDADVTG